MNLLTEHEGSIRLGVFLGFLLVMATLEALFPRRDRSQTRSSRWFTNLGLIVIDSIVVRVCLPVVATGVAVIAAEKNWGLLNILDLPILLELILAVVVLDMLIYWQHVATHRIPVLWRLHKVHHADRDIDATTGIRFHPVEIVLSMIYKLVCIMLLGPAVLAVILFEIILNACAIFNHANMRLPAALDRIARLIIVTPDMHRIHHSVIEKETNSNYGFSLSLWDRMFNSYTQQPRDGHVEMSIGLSEYQTSKPSNLLWTLVIPFKKKGSK